MFLSQYFLSASFHQCSTLICISTQLLSEGQAGEDREPSNKTTLSRTSGNNGWESVFIFLVWNVALKSRKDKVSPSRSLPTRHSSSCSPSFWRIFYLPLRHSDSQTHNTTIHRTCPRYTQQTNAAQVLHKVRAWRLRRKQWGCYTSQRYIRTSEWRNNMAYCVSHFNLFTTISKTSPAHKRTTASLNNLRITSFRP